MPILDYYKTFNFAPWQGRGRGKIKSNTSDTTGSAAEIKSVLKRTQTFRANPTSSISQIHSGQTLHSAEGQIVNTGSGSGGTPTLASTTGIQPGLNADESGSSTTATSAGGGGGAGAKAGSASITTRGTPHFKYFIEYTMQQLESCLYSK